jgi:glyoxylase-like metal-dependent hydrolase (beta-lactamase superfamily II)
MMTFKQVVSDTIFRKRRTKTESSARFDGFRRYFKALMNRKKLKWLVVVPLAFQLTAAPVSNAAQTHLSSASGRPDLEYLKAVNQEAPPRDPQLLFLLMAQYASANRHAEGAEFFSARLKEFGPRLTDVEKALYLSAIGLLRAQHAPAVPLLQRIGWVKETIAILDQARQLSGGEVFVVNWTAGVVHAQLPNRFHQRKAAQVELQWCIDNVEKAPHVAWLREVYFQLARLASADGDKSNAKEYLRRSGYTDLNKPIVLTTPFSEDLATGHAFAPRRIVQIVPERVYALSGFEFTEYYFVVSDDKKQLIGIDAGTRPDSAKAAYEALRAYAPGLPELTTIFFTHAHWDHIGGHAYFRSLNSQMRFYARSNYQEELAKELNAPGNLGRHFFGERFKVDDLRSFKADILVDHPMEVNVGGTRIGLIPVAGGETPDALLIELPEQGVMFVGDFIMPYLGAPFVEEGNLQGLLDAIDVIVEKHPKYLLHGHEPLTRNFTSSVMLGQLKTDLAWLREQVLGAIRRGDDNATIQQANLIPPELLTHHPAAQLPYLLMREHVIDRLYDQNVGYWQGDLTGITHPSRADRAEVLVDYLGVSEAQLVKALQHMVADGKYELATSLLESSQGRFENSESLRKTERLIYLKLMEQYQNSDPFKYLLYSAKAAQQTPQMAR